MRVLLDGLHVRVPIMLKKSLVPLLGLWNRLPDRLLCGLNIHVDPPSFRLPLVYGSVDFLKPGLTKVNFHSSNVTMVGLHFGSDESPWNEP